MRDNKEKPFFGEMKEEDIIQTLQYHGDCLRFFLWSRTLKWSNCVYSRFQWPPYFW